MNSVRKIVASGLGTGYLPVAPGTWGSAVVAGIFVAAAYGSGGRMICAAGTMAVIVLLASAGCVALGRWAEQHWGRKDPSYCTLDEWAGQALALIALPMGRGPEDWLIAVGAGFVAFRFFDIVKLPPARRLERLPGGWGILADDLAAGAYANIVSQIVVRCALGMLF